MPSFKRRSAQSQFGFPQLVQNIAPRVDIETVDSEQRSSLCNEIATQQRAKTFWSFVYENSTISPADAMCRDGRSLLVGHRYFDDGIWDFLT